MNNGLDCLIVEDSPSQALQLQALLEQHGYRVQVAGDGQIALSMLETVHPTVVISDVVMPVMNGYDLCRAIKSNPRMRGIMVMLLTQLSDAEDIFRALECGADNFVTKPADPPNLLARIDYLIANRKLRDEESMSAGLEVNFGGQRQFITSSRLQILNLLLSTYDLAVQKNKELRQTSEALQYLNSELEHQVEERTKKLTAEVSQRRLAELNLQRQHLLTQVVEFAASTANENTELDDACRGIISHTCERIAWPAARLYRLRHDSARPAPVDILHLQTSSAPWAGSLSRDIDIKDDSLSAVLNSGKPQWRRCVAGESLPENMENCTVLAVPILVRDAAVGALQFFHEGVVEEDGSLEKAVSQVGLHVGRMIERQINTHALHEREAFLQAILDYGAAVIVVKDQQGKYLLCNTRFEKLVGLPREEIIGKTDTDLFPQAVATKLREQDLRVSMTQEMVETELEFNQNDGTHTYFCITFPLYDADGSNYAVCMQATDITERKRAEEERRLLYIAGEQTAAGLAMAELDGKVVMVNAAMERFCRLPRNQIATVDDINLGGEEVTGACFGEIWRHISSEKNGQHSAVFAREESEGGDLYVQVRFSPVLGDGGEVTHYLVIASDLSEQRRLETQVRRRQRIESLGTLAGGIAHDFNNILTAILGYTDLALMHLEEKEQVEEELGYVRKAGIRAQHLVQQILRFSKPAESHFAPTNVMVLINEVLNLIQASLPKSIEVKTSFDERCGPVMADPNQLHQVLMNLCTNAHQAMGHKPGILEISTENFRIVEGAPEVYPDLNPGTYVRISVSDTGSGMDRETMEKIFDPFFTTKQPKGGTGLGLSVCHRVVRDHKGAITVYSEPGKGTTFHVYLPQATEAENAETYPTPTAQPGGTERIYVVDDEAIIGELTQRKLSMLGYQVLAFTSPLDALEALQQDPTQCDLLITDATMPHMLGPQLAARVAEVAPSLPVLLVSGYKEVQGGGAPNENIKGTLVKPVSTPELAATVRNILDATATPPS